MARAAARVISQRTSLRATYTYNGLEQLASRVLTNMTPSGTTHFVHDRAGNVIAETDGSGPAGTVREYIWLPGAEIAPTFAAHVPVDRPSHAECSRTP
ncbi:MAG: hypothetical protein F9K29_25110 [Hyphomicrobiaceae bacterium]|nr:MAG: hypothetical protein F9K29_25110 [Hyphomicrobiaceae bacterium]